MLQSSGYTPNRRLAHGEIEGAPCVEFNMRFFGAPSLHAAVRHEIAVIRCGNTSFTVRHRICSESDIYAEMLDTRVWSVHGEHGLRKSPLPPEVVAILNDHLDAPDPE
jgi:acyl-CoA thioesterase FadM